MTLTLPAAGRAAGQARQATRDALAAWRVAHLEDTAVLIVSELVTNAVRHARTGPVALALRLEGAGAWLRIEVMTPTRTSHGSARPTGLTSPDSACFSSRPWPGSGASARRQAARRSGRNWTPGRRLTTRSRGCRPRPLPAASDPTGPVPCWRRTAVLSGASTDAGRDHKGCGP